MGDSGCAAVADCDVEVQENAHTSPMEGIFSKTPHPLEISISLPTFPLHFFGLKVTAPCPLPQESICARSMDVFLN